MATAISEYPAELRSFDIWLAVHRRKESQGAKDCQGCGEAPAVTDDDHCVACAKYIFGYDQATCSVAGQILAGAVRGALDAMVSPEQVAAIVQDAITSDHVDRENAMYRRLTEALS
jgi:hypothetical protein